MKIWFPRNEQQWNDNASKAELRANERMNEQQKKKHTTYNNEYEMEPLIISRDQLLHIKID